MKRKMTKKAVNVTVFTIAALIFVLVFGYTFNVFREINAMDLGSGCGELGIAADNIAEDSSKAGAGEAEAVRKTETVILNCMEDRDILCSIRADYEEQRLVLLMLPEGTSDAATAADPAEWEKICDLVQTCAEDGQKIAADNGLEGWRFDVEILNDRYPVNALLEFEGGKCTYDARTDR